MQPFGKKNMTREDIAIRFVEERTRLGYSQRDFASKLDVTNMTMRRYEIGEREVSAELLAKASTLGLDVQYVLTGVHSANRADLPKAESASPQTQFTINGGTVGVAQVNGGQVKVDARTIHAPKIVETTKVELKPGNEHINEEQAATLMRLVNEIVDLEGKVKKAPKTHRAVWSSLNSHMKVARYRMIPLDSFEKAEKYLRQWIGRLNSGATAQKNDGDAWRKRKYSYIKINSKDQPEKIASYIKKNFKAASLTDLSNEELEQTYRYAASLKKANKTNQ